MTGIEKCKKSAVTDVPAKDLESWEKYASSHLSVVMYLDMYLEAHTHFEGI